MKNNTKQMNAKQRQRIRQREKAKLLKQVGREVVDPSSKNPRWYMDVKETTLPFGIKLPGIKAGSGMVGVAPKAMDPQRSTPRLKSARGMDGNIVDVITGTDLIATVSSGASGNQVGDLLVTQLISPSQFETSRLRQFSALYQRYRFTKIHFIYEPIANATQSGQLVGYADFDPDNTLLINSPANVQTAVAHQGQKITQIWEPVVFDMAQVGTFTDLYTEPGASNSDPRLSLQGIFYLIAASTLPSNIPLGNIYIDYEVQFSIPFLESQAEVLTFGASLAVTGPYILSGSSPTTFNIGSPQTVYYSDGPYAPSYGSGSLYFDQSFMGVPFVQGQNLTGFLVTRATPSFNPASTSTGSVAPILVSCTPPGSATLSIAYGPSASVINGSTLNYGCGTFFRITFNNTCVNLVIGFSNSLPSNCCGPGNYYLQLHVDSPPLLAQKNLLKATYLKFKRQSSLRKELQRLLQEQKQFENVSELWPPRPPDTTSGNVSDEKEKSPTAPSSPTRAGITPARESTEELRRRLSVLESFNLLQES